MFRDYKRKPGRYAMFLLAVGTSNGWHCVNGGLVRPVGELCTLVVGDSYCVGDTKSTVVAFE